MVSSALWFLRLNVPRSFSRAESSHSFAVKETYAPLMRMWCNGNTLAFQADVTGSSPAIHSKPLWALRRKGGEINTTAFILWYAVRLERLAASWRFIHAHEKKTCDLPLQFLCFDTYPLRLTPTAATDT